MVVQDRLDNIVRNLYETMPAVLDERQKRLLAGCIADGYGHGGIKYVCGISGMNYRTVKSGADERKGKIVKDLSGGGVREKGAGRPGIEAKYPNITWHVTEILETNTYGDPEHIITWTNLSLRDIVGELERRYGTSTNKNVVADIMAELGYSRQANQKHEQVGPPHADRDMQFRFINETAKAYMAAGCPVISVDTKKKELIGNFKNGGTEYRPKKTPRKVLDHDFPLDGGKVSPYGVYVINNNTAYVNLGTDHDTSAFAVESIRRWWNIVGKATFPDAHRLYINCDGGGSNGWRARLWKYELALFAEEAGIEIQVSHFPPGTSKWNKIEHRLFCFITKNWQGKPLLDINTTVNLIASTKTASGLEVKCDVDNNTYAIGLKVPNEEFAQIDIEKNGPNESWNYIIRGFKKCI